MWFFFSFLRFSQRFIYFLFGDSFLFYNTLFLFLCGSLRLSDNLIGSQRSVSINQNFMKFIWNGNAFSWRFKLTQTHMKSICIVICQIYSADDVWKFFWLKPTEMKRSSLYKLPQTTKSGTVMHQTNARKINGFMKLSIQFLPFFFGLIRIKASIWWQQVEVVNESWIGVSWMNIILGIFGWGHDKRISE